MMIRPEFSPPVPEGGPRTPRQIWHNMREGFRYVRSHQTVGNLVLLVGMFGLFAFSFNALIPVFVRYYLLPHAPDTLQVRVFGILESVRGIGALGGALTVAFLGSARRQRNMLIAGSILGTVILFGFAASRTLWLAYTTMSVASYAFVLCFATSNTLMQLTVPDQLRGRVMSIYTLMFIGTMPIGSLFAGMLARYIGSPATICICAGISLATAIIVSFRKGGLKDIDSVTSHYAVA
jgi:MFS family permease